MDYISKDLHRHIQSFMTVEEYLNSKLYLKDTECKYQEDKIKLFKELFNVIPNILICNYTKTMGKRIAYDYFLKHNKLNIVYEGNLLNSRREFREILNKLKLKIKKIKINRGYKRPNMYKFKHTHFLQLGQ